MDGFTGYKTAAAENLPDAVEVMDPFHVVQLAGDGLDKVRQRVQHETTGHRGRKGDALYSLRRTLKTGQSLLTEKQHVRLSAVFQAPEHHDVHQAWQAYQAIISAYRCEDHSAGKRMAAQAISTIKRMKNPSPELRRLGNTLHRRRADILAYFDQPHTSNGPTEAINGRLEHLRGIALGFRNLTNYRIRSLLETGGLNKQIHPQL